MIIKPRLLGKWCKMRSEGNKRSDDKKSGKGHWRDVLVDKVFAMQSLGVEFKSSEIDEFQEALQPDNLIYTSTKRFCFQQGRRSRPTPDVFLHIYFGTYSLVHTHKHAHF